MLGFVRHIFLDKFIGWLSINGKHAIFPKDEGYSLVASALHCREL